jgi:hypothetical protein
MGGYRKGYRRPTSLTSARQTVLSIGGSSLRGGSELALATILSVLFPVLAPIIWAAYVTVKAARIVLDGYKDYEQLKRTTSEGRAAAIATARAAAKQTIKQATSDVINEEMQEEISSRVTGIVQTDQVQNVVENIFKTDEDQNNMNYMQQATLEQFVKGAIDEGKDKLIDRLVKETIK